MNYESISINGGDIAEQRAAEIAWRQAAHDEAKRRGTCTRSECLFRPDGKLRFVKHRGGVCPKWLKGSQRRNT